MNADIFIKGEWWNIFRVDFVKDDDLLLLRPNACPNRFRVYPIDVCHLSHLSKILFQHLETCFLVSYWFFHFKISG